MLDIVRFRPKTIVCKNECICIQHKWHVLNVSFEMSSACYHHDSNASRI